MEKTPIQVLLEAKELSDRRDYKGKARLLRWLMNRSDGFVIDSEEGDIIGLTHKPTGFRIHLPREEMGRHYEDLPRLGDAYMEGYLNKEAASLGLLLKKALPVWKRNTTNNHKLARRFFGSSVDDVHYLGITSNDRSYIKKNIGKIYPIPKGGTKEQRSKGNILNNILTYLHEAVERKADKLPWDKRPDYFRAPGGGSHYGASPVLAEHNLITTLNPKLNLKGKFMRHLSNRLDIKALEERIPGFKFGVSPRFSRHALKNLDKIEWSKK